MGVMAPLHPSKGKPELPTCAINAFQFLPIQGRFALNFPPGFYPFSVQNCLEMIPGQGLRCRSLPTSTHAISKEKSTVMKVMDTRPNKNTISAQRSKLSEDRTTRIEEKESRALTMNRTLSIANALSIR